MAQNIILAAELNKEFTAVVNSYLAQGMSFHPNTMAGHQGEIAKVDLTDGKNVYRINMDIENEHLFDTDSFHGNLLVITVERFVDADKSDRFSTFDTLWTGKGEQISRKVWYDISRNRTAWTEDKEEAMKCQEKHYTRSKNKPFRWDDEKQEIKMDTEAKRNFVRDICRQHKGYRRIKRVEMEKLEKATYLDGSRIYKVYFNNGKDALVIKRVNA